MIIGSDSAKGALAIVLASLLWGTTGAAASFSPDVSALAIGAFAMGFGGVLLVLTNISRLMQNAGLLAAHWKLSVLGALSVAIYPLTFYSSMRLSGVAIGTIVSIASAPLFAALIERLLNQKRISLQWGVSFVLGVMGIALLTQGKEHPIESQHDAYQQSLGVLLGCVSGVAYASYAWVARSLIETGVHARSAMSGLFGLAALLLLPSLWFTGDNLFSTTTNGMVSVYMAVVPMFIGYLLFSYGLKYIETRSATLITLIEPLIATLLAALVLGESFKAMGWLGAAMILLCLLNQSYRPRTSV